VWATSAGFSASGVLNHYVGKSRIAERQTNIQTIGATTPGGNETILRNTAITCFIIFVFGSIILLFPDIIISEYERPADAAFPRSFLHTFCVTFARPLPDKSPVSRGCE